MKLAQAWLLSYDAALAIVRTEIEKHYDGEFSDGDRLIEDLKICSDDLSFIASDLEKLLKIKISQDDYDHINTVADWARAIHIATATCGK